MAERIRERRVCFSQSLQNQFFKQRSQSFSSENVAENIVLPPTLRRRNGARSGRPGNRRLIIIVYSLCEDAHAKQAEFRRRRNSSIRSNVFFTLKLLFLAYTQDGGGAGQQRQCGVRS